jgi:hypothetical protein
MATFNGASFRILHGGHQRKREAAVSVRHIPGSDMSYVDLGGRMAGGGSYSVYFESYGQYTALLAQIGQQGSLTYHDGTFTAILTSLTLNTRYPGDHRFGTAEFVIL